MLESHVVKLDERGLEESQLLLMFLGEAFSG